MLDAKKILKGSLFEVAAVSIFTAALFTIAFLV